jgi:cytochrome c oxidase subunit I
MKIDNYIENAFAKELTKKWLLLAVGAVALAGVFAILIVLLRIPSFHDILPFQDFFKTALIVHVDLSVVVWMLALTSMLWCVFINKNNYATAKIAFYISAIGTILIAVSPFTGEGNPILNNYVPILHNLAFFIGLALFFCGILIQNLLCLISYKRVKNFFEFSIYSSALMVFGVILAFSLSINNIEQVISRSNLELSYFYELVFWGAGHILQFAYTQILNLAWLIIALALFSKVTFSKNFFRNVMLLNLALGLTGLFAYYLYETDSGEFYIFFTNHMRYFGGVVPTILGSCLTYNLFKADYKKNTPEFAALANSIFLFFTGGIIGAMIAGSNVTIPAHYHGSIVGISIALMGMVYIYLPKVGYRKVTGKLAVIQPYIYCIGQLIHVLALAWSGGYGVMRKTPGAVPSLEAKFAMGLMGIGGLIAIIGGLIFVTVVYKSMRKAI